jgi:hypothetical protein
MKRIFDDDNNNSINYKELMVGLLILKNSPIDGKIKELVQICEYNSEKEIQ